MLGAAGGVLEKGRGKREDGSSRIKGLLFPAWDTTLGARRGALGSEQRSLWEKQGAPSPLSGTCTAPTPPRVGQAPLGLSF